MKTALALERPFYCLKPDLTRHGYVYIFRARYFKTATLGILRSDKQAAPTGQRTPFFCFLRQQQQQKNWY